MQVGSRAIDFSPAHVGVLLSVAVAACAPHAASEQCLPPYMIEKPAIARPGNPAPVYPAELLPAADTATVRIRVAVEPSGRADTASVEVLTSPHPAFTRAVLEVLPRYVFLPAETGAPGRRLTKVRSVVEIPFHFVPPAVAVPSSGAPPG